MPAEPRRPTRLLTVAPLLAAIALGGCSRGQGFTEFATNVRDRVAGEAALEESQRSLLRAPKDAGNGLIRPKARPAGAAQAGRPGDEDNATGAGSASGGADANATPKPAAPPVIYYYPTTPAPAAPSQ